MSIECLSSITKNVMLCSKNLLSFLWKTNKTMHHNKNWIPMTVWYKTDESCRPWSNMFQPSNAASCYTIISIQLFNWQTSYVCNKNNTTFAHIFHTICFLELKSNVTPNCTNICSNYLKVTLINLIKIHCWAYSPTLVTHLVLLQSHFFKMKEIHMNIMGPSELYWLDYLSTQSW
jgi:hypothetical protein